MRRQQIQLLVQVHDRFSSKVMAINESDVLSPPLTTTTTTTSEAWRTKPLHYYPILSFLLLRTRQPSAHLISMPAF